MQETIKILLADDHHLLMDGIESLFIDSPHIVVVGKASSVPDAEALINTTKPHILITDISMGESSGLDLTRSVTAMHPLIKIIVLSMHEDVHHVLSLMQAGASGYLLKNVKRIELLKAIDEVRQGKTYIQQSLAAAYGRALQRSEKAEINHNLTPREIEILRLVAAGNTSAKISKDLFLSEFTVNTHRKNIGKKTGARSAVGLIHFAQKEGLI